MNNEWFVKVKRTFDKQERWASSLKKGYVLLALSVILLVLSFLPIYQFLPEWSSSNGDYDLAPNHVNSPTIHLFYKDVVVVDVAISGANKDVYFYITDSNGRRVLNVGRIYDGYHLEWNAPGIGSYRFNFDNSMSIISHKYVDWSLRAFHYNSIFFFSGIALLIISVIQIIREERIEYKRRRTEKKEAQLIKCRYCGTSYEKTQAKCPNCGASLEQKAHD